MQTVCAVVNFQAELHNKNIDVARNSAFMVKFCYPQQYKLYIGPPVFERNYIATNLHSFHTFINAAIKQKNVRLLVAYF
jgi:hypothetical protein